MSFFTWWYGSGWSGQIRRIKNSQIKLIDQFSIPGLAATLFSPFRQISAGSARTNTSLDVKYHMWLDRLFSRFFGAFVRFFTILAGCIALLSSFSIGIVRVIAWPLLPLLPVLGLYAGMIGFVPWK